MPATGGNSGIGVGSVDGRLAPCPHKPNCVSSQAAASDKQHYIEGLTCTAAALKNPGFRAAGGSIALASQLLAGGVHACSWRQWRHWRRDDVEFRLGDSASANRHAFEPAAAAHCQLLAGGVHERAGRFVDDVEFLFDDNARRIDIRSAAWWATAILG